MLKYILYKCNTKFTFWF